MNLLMHICCAPCATYPVKYHKEKEDNITLLFFNPNIHPYKEYENRLKSVRDFAENENLKLIVIDEYNLVDFLQKSSYREERRCFFCYQTRMERTASVCKSGNFDAFTTTLGVSPYQKHNFLEDAMLAAREKYSVKSIYMDYRDGFSKGREMARDKKYYMQNYCGCIYSEAERFAPKNSYDYYRNK